MMEEISLRKEVEELRNLWKNEGERVKEIRRKKKVGVKEFVEEWRWKGGGDYEEEEGRRMENICRKEKTEV